jgi:hypothetical protein
MTPELAAKLAHLEAEDRPLHLQMQRTDELFQANCPDAMRLPFAKADIVFAAFTDFLREQATQREKDLVVVSELLTRCWKALHISAQTLGEVLSPADAQELEALAPALQRLGLLRLLTDGLTQRWALVVAQAASAECGIPTPTEAERQAALRFCETCEDGEGYDVPAPMMRRLAALGYVQHRGGGWYEGTPMLDQLQALEAQKADAGTIAEREESRG